MNSVSGGGGGGSGNSGRGGGGGNGNPRSGGGSGTCGPLGLKFTTRTRYQQQQYQVEDVTNQAFDDSNLVDVNVEGRGFATSEELKFCKFVRVDVLEEPTDSDSDSDSTGDENEVFDDSNLVDVNVKAQGFAKSEELKFCKVVRVYALPEPTHSDSTGDENDSDSTGDENDSDYSGEHDSDYSGEHDSGTVVAIDAVEAETTRKHVGGFDDRTVVALDAAKTTGHADVQMDISFTRGILTSEGVASEDDVAREDFKDASSDLGGLVPQGTERDGDD